MRRGGKQKGERRAKELKADIQRELKGHTHTHGGKESMVSRRRERVW